jgi:histone deacetylase 6
VTAGHTGARFASAFIPETVDRASTVSPQSLSLNPVAPFVDGEPPPKVEEEVDSTLIPFEDSSFQPYNLKRKRSSTVSMVTAKVPIVVPQLTHVPLKTGICYDVRMRYHSRIVTNSYDYVDPHPEDPRRIYRIYKAIAEAGLITDPDLKGATELGPLMDKVHTREATDQEILSVHTQEHLDFIESTTRMSREQLIEETDKGDSIYLSNDSHLSAKLSCGGAIEACRAVVERKVKNCIAVVRPPGHHAEPQAPGGFCLFSNVAVAAKAMLTNYPETVRRILVLDWDVHHGNGTQKAFFDDDRVLYVSLHRHENGRFYPGTPFGGHTVIGRGVGEGFSVNIPWSHAGMGDGDYIYAFNKVVMPIAVQYDPDLVIISAGFDAAEGDLIGGCLVSPNGYGYMTHILKSLANGQLVVVLEGGYNLDAISSSALAVTKVLLGDPPGFPKTKLPSREAIKVVDEVIKVQSPFWKCLRLEIGECVKLDTADKHERLGGRLMFLWQTKVKIGGGVGRDSH